VRPNSDKRKRAARREDIAASQASKVIVGGLTWPVLAPLAFLLLAILLVVVARVRLLGVPLERDEGEYAYLGALMLQGVAPYGIAANMKLPGTNAAYALIMAVFGHSIYGIHFGFLLVNGGAILLVYFLARRFFGVAAGVAAAASYAVLSVGAGVLGLWAHATHFVVLPALGATLLLLQWVDRPRAARLAGSGFLFGMAFLMKQPGALFAVFGLLFLIYSQRQHWQANRLQVFRDVLLFGGAVLLPFAVTCALLWHAGVFGDFWLWVFTYARKYVGLRTMSIGINALQIYATPIATANAGICLLAATGLFMVWRRREHRNAAVILTGFLICSFLAVCPGLYFREHYFVLMLPAVALLVGAFATTATKSVAAVWPLWLVVAALGYTIGKQEAYLFQLTPQEESVAVYGRNPFPEAIPVADYIRDRTRSDDRIAVLGSEPEIYFYAQRRAAVPYVYIYPLVEAQPLAALMQMDFIRDVEAAKPKFLVVVNISASWLVQANAPAGLFRWMTPYCKRYYDQVGVVDLLPQGTKYQWDAEAVNYQPRASNYLLILRRKAEF